MTNSQDNILMVGACGMGMGPLATYLRARGHTVHAWDDKPRERLVKLLKGHGVKILKNPAIPAGTTLLVYSTAVSPDHELRVAARELGIPQLRRGEMLAAQAGERRLLAIAGSHGKTTTTGMLIHTLRKVGFPAGYVLGGLFADDADPASAGENDWLIAEVDESDGTIEHFSPEITLVPNLDWDHADLYRHAAEIEAAFGRLFRRTKGYVFISESDVVLNRLAEENPGPKYIRFGIDGDYSGALEQQKGITQELKLGGEFKIARASVRAIGDFNAVNALSALAAAQHLTGEIREDALADFSGIRRRQTLLLERKNLHVYQDYAHHPSEIEPLLRALRQAHPESRLITVFQPHRYTRTAQFKANFARVLERADRVLLLDVYPASERPVPGGTTADLLAQFHEGAPVEAIATRAELLKALSKLPSPAILAFVGAGDIEDWADEFVNSFNPGRGRRSQNGVQLSVYECLRSRVSSATPILQDEPLGRRTTLGVGGPAKFYAEPATLADLQGLLAAAHDAGVEVLALGRGSNLLVMDDGFPGLVVRLSSEAFCGIEQLDAQRLRIGAGARLKSVCGEAAKLGLSGFEFLEGIPASVGGALRMNAGAMGGWIFDVVESIEYLTLEGELRTLPASEVNYTYRECTSLKDSVATGAVIKARDEALPDVVRAAMDQFAAKRKGSQPRDPSAGCMFKNPEGDAAGRLIDISGLKGLRVGGAEVSEVHGNFVVNIGGATCDDVLQLIRKVRKTVQERHGVLLEPEVLLVGAKWEDIL